MDQCSTGTTSHQPYRLLTHRRGHDLDLGLKDRSDSSAHPPAARTADWHTPVRCAPISRTALRAVGSVSFTTAARRHRRCVVSLVVARCRRCQLVTGICHSAPIENGCWVGD